MTYKEYPSCTKTFVVVHKTGFGVMEAPYEEKEVVFESDDMNIAQLEAERLTKQNNEPSCGSWKLNTYWVNINVLTDEGKRLEKQFANEFDERLKQGLADGKYNVRKVGDMTLYTDKTLDEFCKQPESDTPLTSSKFMIIDLNEEKKDDSPTRIVWSEPKKPIE